MTKNPNGSPIQNYMLENAITQLISKMVVCVIESNSLLPVAFHIQKCILANLHNQSLGSHTLFSIQPILLPSNTYMYQVYLNVSIINRLDNGTARFVGSTNTYLECLWYTGTYTYTIILCILVSNLNFRPIFFEGKTASLLFSTKKPVLLIDLRTFVLQSIE